VTNVPFVFKSRVAFLCGVISFFVVIVCQVVVGGRTISSKMAVIGRDDTTDGGVTKGVRGSALHVCVAAFVTIGTTTVGAFAESASNSEPSVKPWTLFFVTPSCYVYSESFIQRERRGGSDVSIP
jgi:hypothetical protein